MNFHKKPPLTYSCQINALFMLKQLHVFFLLGLIVLNAFFTQATAQFANGADVGWLTEMEASGRKFYDNNGVEKDLFDILKAKCINSIRLRVWVNPAGGWNNKSDVLAKAIRAKNKGFRIMIDFHYSDSWADPGQQNKPAAWANHNISQLGTDVYNHTTDVLNALLAVGITPEWVQVGNETNNGMLWEEGRASVNMNNFAQLVLSGYNAVKAVSPTSKVIVHLSNGYDNGLFRWMFDGLKNNGAKWDIIGMSLYPTASNWSTLTSQCLTNMNDMVSRYNKEVMVVEVGMAVSEATACNSFLTDIIQKVKSVSGGKGLGVFYWEPQSYNGWKGYQLGAFDNSGKPTVAMNAFMNSCNQPPSISITSPANNASFTAAATVTINASASDPDGSVSKVDFYNGTTLLGSDASAPYSYTWTNVSAGSYIITAKVTDNGGAVTTSTFTNILVNPGVNKSPLVSISSPLNNTVLSAPANITITATASDEDGTVSKVEFYNGASLLGSDASSPYSFAWNNVAAGTYTFTAKATDNSGAVTTSATITVIVNAAPEISITFPANNMSFDAPATIFITVSATDPDGSISKVEFYNGTTLLGSDVSSPYIFPLDNVPAGTYHYTAKATDNAGAVTTSSIVIVIVNAVPTVSITSPANNSSFNAPASITITAEAGDEDGSISKVEFYNGTTLLGSDASSPYNYIWTNSTPGFYIITAKAIDNKGASISSTGITVTVHEDVSTGMNKINATFDLIIYPNPTSDLIELETSIHLQNRSITILNSLGEEVASEISIAGKSARLNVHELPAGMYILVVRQENYLMQKKNLDCSLI